MSEPTPHQEPFLTRVSEVIRVHLEEEDFGVAELADEMSMSRSTLLRKVKSATGLSAALFIRQQRLRHARHLLQTSSLNISEVAYKTGFSSSSYFTKCFREEYGYPPGEEGKQEEAEQSGSPQVEVSLASRRLPVRWAMAALIGGLLLAVVAGVMWMSSRKPAPVPRKTIAVLPFQNDSPDSSNVYLINGLMAALIDNLHQVEQIQVTSRTTVERYRGASLTIPELSKELGVSYFVEGSGQKIGEELLLTLRLVDAKADTLIWARRYKRETTDIFELQAEVSTSIAQEIEVLLTPEEQHLLALPPTDNLVAYDHFLRGMDQIREETREGLLLGIESFQQAIAEDAEFAHPHAFIAISYYFLDLFQQEQIHVEEINRYADKALLLDPDLNESLIGKALYYLQSGQYDLAIQFFDKVLTKSPDLGWVHNLLSTIYTLHQPNTERYLRHAIQGIRYAGAGQDSGAASMAYLHLGNALTQNGFLDEAIPFAEKSLQFQPGNIFAGALSIYLELGKTDDIDRAYDRFLKLLDQDNTNLFTLNEVAKLALYKGDYQTCMAYYQRLQDIKQAAALNVYPDADINIAYALDQLGRTQEAEAYRSRYRTFLEGEESAYRDLGYAVLNASLGDDEAALASLIAFSQQERFQYWMVRFIDQEPLLKPLASDPAYQAATERIRNKFWNQHRRMRKVLEVEEVL